MRLWQEQQELTTTRPAKRPDPKTTYQLDRYAPFAAGFLALVYGYRDFRRECRNDLQRMLDYQLRELDDAQADAYERHFAAMLAASG